MRRIQTIASVALLAAGASAQARPGDDADGRLIEAATDTNLDVAARARAVEALGEVPTPRARRFVHELVTTAREVPEVLAAAIQSYTAMVGNTEPRDAVRVAEKYLDHSQWMVREAAARALGKLGTPEAEEALRERWKREKTGVVKLALSAALIDAHRHH